MLACTHFTLTTLFAYCLIMTVCFSSLFMFLLTSSGLCQQQGRTNYKMNLSQFFSVAVSDICVCLCVHECVSHFWFRHLLFRHRQCWEKQVILRLPHTDTHCCLPTLWVADRKGANCGINRCMLGTDWLTNGGWGALFWHLNLKETGLRWLSAGPFLGFSLKEIHLWFDDLWNTRSPILLTI